MGNSHGRRHHLSSGRRNNNPPPPPPPYNNNNNNNNNNNHQEQFSENSVENPPKMGLRLPYCHVDSCLRGLAGQAEGFGRFAIGGLNGAVYCVTTLSGGRGHDVDGIQIKPNSKHIWIDRCTLSDYDDGLIDITRQSTDITVSRCHFANHDKRCSLGQILHTRCRCIRVTIHHCFFDGTRQRHPRLRFGKVHLYNNYTRNWGIYAVCASVESQVYSQCNIYEAGQKKVAFKYYTEKAADRAAECTGCIKSEGDLFISGTQPGLTPLPSETCVFHPSEYYNTWTVEAPTDDLKHLLHHCTGWQGIPRPSDLPIS
ncbi:hypothetical protein BUALT_Bualt09G0066900 [Buddleja alternifolia]|uniref:Pectate lyase domain-containing protein n=1 Tax=Buddleja alternifolia TaxID=168488 RepID=A0AAV6XBD1_9LAMI|nr:hypothetical protein BUALT_Bualt09G0066900 [Buddleja alternifolia]